VSFVCLELSLEDSIYCMAGAAPVEYLFEWWLGKVGGLSLTEVLDIPAEYEFFHLMWFGNDHACALRV
jgi:hypothetical protein